MGMHELVRATRNEVDRLQGEVESLRAEIERLNRELERERARADMAWKNVQAIDKGRAEIAGRLDRIVALLQTMAP